MAVLIAVSLNRGVICWFAVYDCANSWSFLLLDE